MRATAGFHADDPVWLQGACLGENALIFFGIDIVGHYRKLIAAAHGFA